MIAFVQGLVQYVEQGHIVIDVGGVGIRVAVPDNKVDFDTQIGFEIKLWTHLILRQDSIALYGFFEQDQLHLFELLLGAPGVGPKLALAFVSTISFDDLRVAVTGNQPELLSQVPGVGVKTAKKISFYLQDKMEIHVSQAKVGTESVLDVELLDALTSLGYSVAEAQNTIKSIQIDSENNLEERIVLALRHLSK
ncbi:MAG TPA: Holliday junction branch migration protein RuvA [Chloroflexi bacterium]|nr:Holliday junction branch migration protein RuvA [Chloroflexota bacterium]HCU99447.1 Holliday junction branch migration protein RuvA [Chloroflexota bacterium]|tara:strand:+ start:644 stop:1225 length:582 start_codon:yes stop_codon:yes gene_type:complete